MIKQATCERLPLEPGPKVSLQRQGRVKDVCLHRRRSGIERLDHHIDLALVSNEQPAGAECCADRIHHLVETAGCALLLGEARDAELVPLAVLDDGHQFDSKRHFLQVEICRDKW